MMMLYDFGNSVCCQKVRITLRAKGLDWEAVKVDLFKAEQYDPRYLKLNPKGIVPTLVHDGKPIIESTLICEYLDDTFPQPRLIPADPWLRTRMRLWSKMVDEGLFEGVTEISFSAMFRERMRNMPEETRERRFRNIGDPRRRDRFMSTYEHGVRSPFVNTRDCRIRAGVRDTGGYAGRVPGRGFLGESQPRRHQSDAVCGAARLSGTTRPLDRGPAARDGLVGTRARMAEL